METSHRVEGVRLRLAGVYALPNGTEHVVGCGRGSHYFLYHPSVWMNVVWVLNMPIEYEVDIEGRIITGTGNPTGWYIEDLMDTQRTIEKNFRQP